MLILKGAPALSAFRIAKLTERLAGIEPRLRRLRTRFVHFVDLSAPLDSQEQDVLARLLTYGPAFEPERETSTSQSVLVVPRPGTISPWSSKATDIAQVCGLSSVIRMERGVEYLLGMQLPDGLWGERHFTATGFPRVFYLRYHGYPKFFPLWALARYRTLRARNRLSVPHGM